ncbi:DedA family membrane protein [Neisseria wadsworthii 9715]|uniref:DedA family membrane protein n=1 Tax=Neisseria wadsworthii 9715 TaxID=1030841 RepID=G4CQE4_9NEIS|nr:DedA family membrane protein [Neisseria wadsworthii 9715]
MYVVLTNSRKRVRLSESIWQAEGLALKCADFCKILNTLHHREYIVIATVIDFILHIDQHLQALSADYGPWIYAILFLIVFCETGLVVTPFLPGDSLLFAAGGIAAVGGMNIHLMVLLLLIAAIVGDAVNFMIGKYFGAKLFANPDSKIFKRSYLDKTHQFYQKYGGKTIIIARFVPIVRTFAPFVAGMAHMNYARFIRFNIIGAVLWVVLFSYAGYFFANIPVVKNNLGLVLGAIIVVSVMPAVIEVVRARMAAKKS